jgi:hypothetical protein
VHREAFELDAAIGNMDGCADVAAFDFAKTEAVDSAFEV